MTWQVSLEDTAYIVRIEWNDSEGEPGESFYGPFTEDEANDFAENWNADDTEIGDVTVVPLNFALKEEEEPARKYCGQDFMAGTICTLPPGHDLSNGHQAYCQDCGGDWMAGTCTCDDEDDD